MEQSRIGASEFEAQAEQLVAAEGLNVESFKAMFQIFRLATLMFSDLESKIHRPSGWSLAGFRVMFILWVAGDLEPRDIARLAGLSRAAISSTVNTLERDQLVERRRQSVDRRLVTVSLTPIGNDRLAAAYAAQNDREQEIFSSLDSLEVARLTELMQRVIATPRTE
ncbi:MarR family transcriptional regulator [Acidimicrobiaceae bacterium AH-315-P05]|nr:MarR family transcriptional regulator [Acidimicrobiaceae bacterium AH-315-P05]